MRRQVHAVVIVRRRGDRLIQTLHGVRSQERLPDTVTVVDLTGDVTSEEVFREQLGRDASVSILQGRSQLGWSEALNLARNSLPADGWVWVLRDDTTPEVSALQALMTTVDGAPSVAIAGPKQRVANQENWLREFGETLTRWGERQAVVDRELDQGQYDRMSDVLAVGDAGVLISLAVFDSLGGADPALDPLDAPLDLGVRARLAGHRVVAVPQAIVFVERGPADWRAGKNLSAANLFRLDRQAWLYRRFAYTPWWALLAVLLASIPLALLRSVGHFVVKRPDFAVAEIVATASAYLRLPQAIVAGARLSRSNSAGWAAIRPLRMTPIQRRQRRQLQQEARFASAEEDARARVQPDFWPGGIWLIAGLLGLGVLISGPLLGAQALVGGGLLPLSSSFTAFWEQARWLTPEAVGGVWGERLIPADPAAVVLALIGSVSWWAPSQAMLWLWVAAPLLAGLVAWWAGAQFVSTRLAATVFAVLWAVQPTLLVSLAEGRWNAVVLHIALPWLLATALTAHTSWQRAAQAGFATATVLALAPVLWPVVLLGWLAVLVLLGWRDPLRALAGTLPLALAPSAVWWLPRFLAPTELALLPGIGRWLADPGLALSSPEVSWWWLALGWPAEPTAAGFIPTGPEWSVVVIGLSVVVIALALAGVIVARSEIGLSASVLFAAGLVIASLSPAVGQGYLGREPIGVWPGSGVALAGLGAALAVAALLDVLAPSVHAIGSTATLRRTAAGALAAVVSVFTVLAGMGEMTRQWSDQAIVAPLAEARTLPALVAAEAATHPNQRTLVIWSLEDGGFAVSLEPGAGNTLERSSTLYRLRPVEPSEQSTELATLVAGLVQPSSAELSEWFEKYSIRFVLYRGDPTSPAALAMAQRESFIPAGKTDSSLLWQVSNAPSSTSVPEKTPEQSGFDLAWWLVWVLAGVLALPTERRPKRAPAEDDDSRLATVLSDDPDE